MLILIWGLAKTTWPYTHNQNWKTVYSLTCKYIARLPLLSWVCVPYLARLFIVVLDIPSILNVAFRCVYAYISHKIWNMRKTKAPFIVFLMLANIYVYGNYLMLSLRIHCLRDFCLNKVGRESWTYLLMIIRVWIFEAKLY